MYAASLWFAAPVLGGRERTDDPASRLRDALILGVAIPGVLAFADVLYGWSCICVVFALVVVRVVRHPLRRSCKSPASRAVAWSALPIVGIVGCAWPLVVRPLLDGDSLSYHLPNAVAWVHAHGIWVSDTRYWWYPGGSELFAAGLFAVAGPFGIPLCGTLALSLLGLRLYAFARKAELRPVVAGAFALVVVTTRVTALESGNLENDVWLTAFLVEMVWCLRFERAAYVRTSLVASLIKPVGGLFATTLAVVGRVSPRTFFVCSIGLLVWAARDLLLLRHAAIPLSAASFPHVEATTIASHGFDGLVTLGAAVARSGIGFATIAIGTLVAIVFGRDRTFRVAAVIFGVIFLCEPFGFNNSIPQLATGQSLRYALPAVVFGALGCLAFLRRYELAFAVCAIVVATLEDLRFIEIFHADGATKGVFLGVVLAAIVALVPKVPLRRSTIGLTVLASIAYAGRLAGDHAASYYDDRAARDSTGRGLYTWLATAKPTAVVVQGTLAGPVEIVSPATRTIESVDGGGCRTALDDDALLLASVDEDRPSASRLDDAKRCGDRLFESENALVVRPQPASDPKD